MLRAFVPRAARCSARRSRAFRVALSIVLSWGAFLSTAAAQQTLTQGTVRVVTPAGRTGPESFTWASGHTVVIERLETGEQLPVNADAHGAFAFRGLPPGWYRLQAGGIRKIRHPFGPWGALRAFRAEFYLHEPQTLTIDVRLEWILDSPPLPPPFIGRAVPSPLDAPCRIDGTARNATPEHRGGTMPDGRELWGVLRHPDGRTPAADVRVFVDEALDTREPADAFGVQVRATETGCFGLAGLWPGRYRVSVDHPPFAFITDVDVTSTAVLRRDITLTAPPEPSGAPVVTLPRSRYARLGVHVTSVADLVAAVQRQTPVPGRASATEGPRTEDVAHVSGGVVWRYKPTGWAYLPNVPIDFTHEASEEARTITTGPDGSYDVYLPQGIYRVTIRWQDFAPLDARLLVLPEGHVVRHGVKGDQRTSGIYRPIAPRHSGLMSQVVHSGGRAVETTCSEAPGSQPGPASCGGGTRCVLHNVRLCRRSPIGRRESQRSQRRGHQDPHPAEGRVTGAAFPHLANG